MEYYTGPSARSLTRKHGTARSLVRSLSLARVYVFELNASIPSHFKPWCNVMTSVLRDLRKLRSTMACHVRSTFSLCHLLAVLRFSIPVTQFAPCTSFLISPLLTYVNIFVVNLQNGDGILVIPSGKGSLALNFEKSRQRTSIDPWTLHGTFHRISLPGASLPIRKDTKVVAIDGGSNQWTNFGKYFLLMNEAW